MFHNTNRLVTVQELCSNCKPIARNNWFNLNARRVPAPSPWLGTATLPSFGSRVTISPLNFCKELVFLGTHCAKRLQINPDDAEEAIRIETILLKFDDSSWRRPNFCKPKPKFCNIRLQNFVT